MKKDLEEFEEKNIITLLHTSLISLIRLKSGSFPASEIVENSLKDGIKGLCNDIIEFVDNIDELY